jgi:hypothetical protein
MINMVNKTCDIRIREAPLELKTEFKKLCVSHRKNYREMLYILIDSYKERKVKYV